MAKSTGKKLFPNPFYVVVLVSSTLFVVTALGYLVSALGFEAKGGAKPSPGSLAVAAWFDRNGPLALGIEFVVMLLFSVMAMATDRWFAPKSTRNGPGLD